MGDLDLGRESVGAAVRTTETTVLVGQREAAAIFVPQIRECT
jgi:hypothetical protein